MSFVYLQITQCIQNLKISNDEYAVNNFLFLLLLDYPQRLSRFKIVFKQQIERIDTI